VILYSVQCCYAVHWTDNTLMTVHGICPYFAISLEAIAEHVFSHEQIVAHLIRHLLGVCTGIN